MNVAASSVGSRIFGRGGRQDGIEADVHGVMATGAINFGWFE